jgi:GT2 family glycosyltransferase
MTGYPQVGRIIAVVVTYNRLDKLRTALESILGQTQPPALTIVVNNASRDGTREWLDELARSDATVRPVHLETNSGGAGGFHRGIAEAVSLRADYIWVMDDDCYPREDALGLLVDAFGEYRERFGVAPGFVCSRVLWKDEVSACLMNIPGVTPDWSHAYSEGLRVVAARWCSFVSCLFRASDVRRLGLPLKEYFIWYDDMEYTRRLAQGKCGLVVLDSIAIHDMPDNEPVEWSKVNPDTLWKYKYGMRNEASWRLYHEGKRSYLHFMRFVWARLRRGKVPFGIRFSIMRAGLGAIGFNPQPDFIQESQGGGERDGR